MRKLTIISHPNSLLKLSSSFYVEPLFMWKYTTNFYTQQIFQLFDFWTIISLP